MAPEEIAELLRSRFGEVISGVNMQGGHPYVDVAVERWPEVALFLRDEPGLQLNFLRCISSLDLIADNKFACIYDLMHVSLDKPEAIATSTYEFAVRVTFDRDNPVIPTVSHVWPAAEWHEREAYDLMGITFSGHPDLRRILCADDWVGHPLRKDYVYPIEYQGIPATTEYELPNPRH